MGNEDREMDLKIEQSLRKNSSWSGSSEAMWDRIIVELPPRKTWWGRQRTWMATVAAAMILLAVLLPYLPQQLPQPSDGLSNPDSLSTPMNRSGSLHTQSEEPPKMEASDNSQPISLFMATMEQPMIEEVEPGEIHEIAVELTPVLFYDTAIESADHALPSLRLIRLSDQGEREIVMKKTLGSWGELGITFPSQDSPETYVASLTLEAPMEPGMYMVEVIGEAEVGTEGQTERLTLSGQTSFIVK